MSKLILVCSRGDHPDFVGRLRQACDRLVPNNIAARPPHVANYGRLVTALVNPSLGSSVRGASVCLGQVFSYSGHWDEPHSAAPDGSYAICRANDRSVELLTDFVGSRTLWYYFDDNLLLASSSQRALVTLLGSFELNREAIPWLLSSGCLGPEAAWDRRFHRLGPDSRLTLDRTSWKLSVQAEPVQFKPSGLTARRYAELLQEALSTVCESLDDSPDQWRLLLSGGVDSRALLLFLRRRAPQCITWGRQAALEEPGNDAFVARSLAARLGVAHRYFSTDHDSSSEPLRVIVHRFLVAGEGSIDHLSGYMDGFAIWRELFQAGITGIIRGDEGFGWIEVASETDVRYSVGALLLEDYFSADLLRRWDLPAQRWPEELQRHSDETLPTWRDRLYHQFRIPVILAALNELKSPYVEIVNPLLSRRILGLVREMPDSLRTDKKLFRRLVRALGPRIPFATHAAIAEPKRILSAAPFVEFMREELSSVVAEGVLPDSLRRQILAGLRSDPGGAPSPKPLLERVKQRVPRRVLMMLKRVLPPRRPSLDPYVLAFRATLLVGMVRMFEEDVQKNSTVPDAHFRCSPDDYETAIP